VSGTEPVAGPPAESVAVVVVTYNRSGLLDRMLVGLAAQTRRPDVVLVVDNASTDDTRAVLARHEGRLPLRVTTTENNLGGAGGFHLGVRQAWEGGWDRIWLMDDDVVPAPDCLAVLMAADDACVMAVREDTSGHLVEKAATRFDLTNPLAIKPKTAMVETDYGSRPCGPAGPATPSGACATRGSCASSPSTSSTTWPGGRASTCTATCSWCTSATATTRWCASSRC
jgi:rhamnopyranosyl-N-acetylglucosaminyl-diphospho-decaprenol beta-1,3/1,4-galactofuranosyltransferase